MKAPGLLVAFLLPFLTAPTAYAATVCSEAELRAALAAGGDINFGCDTQIVLSATLQVTTNVVLDAGTNHVTLSGGGAVRVFEVAEGVSFTLKNLRLVDGYNKGIDEIPVPMPTPSPAAGVGKGAAVAATNAYISIQGCVFSNNVAQGGSGSSTPQAAGDGMGGALFASGGQLRVTNSTFTANKAVGGIGNFALVYGDSWGGAIAALQGHLEIEQSQFEANTSINGGGAIYSVSNLLSVAGASFRSNIVVARSGGRSFAPTPESDGFGGALEIRASTNTLITDSLFQANYVTGGGGFFFSSGTLAGGAIYSDSDLSISRSEFISNFVQGSDNVVPSQVSRGGAICADAQLHATELRFFGNQIFGANAFQTLAGGGGGNGGIGLGGAIFHRGELLLNNSAFVSNTATGGTLRDRFDFLIGWSEGQGSALYSSNRLSATNVTFALNICRDGREGALGAAVFFSTSLTNHIEFSTFATNQFGALSAGSPLLPLHVRTATNSYVSFRGTILSGGSTDTFSGNLADWGYNITSDTLFTKSTSKNATDAKLGPLGFFGGFSQSIPVLAGGPAIDAVPSALAPDTDQRGRARPSGSAADIGAYEVSSPYVLIGRISGNIDLSAVALSASGNPVEVDDNTGTFKTFFSANGSLTPTLNNTLFDPANVTLTAGVEQFDLLFTGYTQNELAIEAGDAGITVTFAVDAAGDYQLQSSTDLQTWSTVQNWTAPADSVFHKEIPAPTTPQFFQVKKL